MTLLLLYLALAVGISFICSILEAVILSINISHISVIEKKHRKAGKVLKHVKVNIHYSIPAILILNTLAHTLGAAGIGAQAAAMYGNEWLFLISVILTLIILFFSEIIPKTIGAMYYKQLAIPSAYIIKVFIFVTYPLIILSGFITNIFIKNSKQKEQLITREELLASTLIGEDEGIIDEKESDIIENVLKLQNFKLKDILTPRSVMFAVEEGMKLQDILKLENIYKFSRVPVYKNNIDNITGVVLVKNIFANVLNNKDVTAFDIKNDLTKLNENIPVSKVLDMFLSKREHMALVVDSYDQTEGIVTLEDCIETMLGVEIVDESDTSENMQELAKKKMKEKRKIRKKK
ncbi:MAG: protein of unknown function DUF21 [uncultured Campylobacterales bacterium]|uniref:Magnesium and cobalt efflux protein CorC n=1 Tax=uncultured Campylobacterales bacterium TaxID=352960 RepID=A0A6S6T0F9_9BACT|nr:MAG: protein of unknown function DUF21 [uncultured Campylobacterales bacterium]